MLCFEALLRGSGGTCRVQGWHADLGMGQESALRYRTQGKKKVSLLDFDRHSPVPSILVGSLCRCSKIERALTFDRTTTALTGATSHPTSPVGRMNRRNFAFQGVSRPDATSRRERENRVLRAEKRRKTRQKRATLEQMTIKKHRRNDRRRAPDLCAARRIAATEALPTAFPSSLRRPRRHRR